MKITSSKLAAQLQTLLPVYVVSGDDPLQVSEAVDEVRQAARAAGIAGREVFFIERSAPWNDILHASQELSLFAERRVLEIRMPGGKPGHGARALLEVIAAAGQDYLLLIVTGRLDRDAQAAQWLRAAEQRGVWLALWPIEAAAFPDWIRARLAQRGLTADADAIALLVERTEGNLLAAHQEIEKLALLGRTNLDAPSVLASVADSTQFDVFKLGEAALAGDAPRVLRILASLRGEGTEATLVLWALLRELRSVWSALQGGDAARGGRSWGRPAASLGDAVARLERSADRGLNRGGKAMPFVRLTERAARADRMIKGQLAGDAWDEITLLALEFCGVRALPLPRRA